MRITFVGAGETTLRTAELLINRGHEVVIIEQDAKLVESLSEDMDCAFLVGDGSNPRILAEADPKATHFLFCLSDQDQHNIIASLVGRSLGFGRVVLSIVDPGYETICSELGLDEVIVPSRTISRYLADMVRGIDTVELSTVLRHQARFFTFTATADDALPLEELDLHEKAQIICIYREEDFVLAKDAKRLHEGDTVIVLTNSDTVAELRERWTPHTFEKDRS